MSTRTRDPRGTRRHREVRAALLARLRPGDQCAHCLKPLGSDPKQLDADHSVPLAIDPDSVADRLLHSRCNRAVGQALAGALRTVDLIYPDPEQAHAAKVTIVEQITAEVQHKLRTGQRSTRLEPKREIHTRTSRDW
ncbi:hypothetical protein [Pseudonocardia sp. WMMC193]|uniref:hypothetical protein n=1 Tax=Pseudonocardia sp. WMMC193 TaxID=2911965 RepID=UPI001F3AE5BA|nr:hypothetical protein [Pseudonocardia sp. WMMC193]MCF7550492.1 hypothetical protein [Pseudonocardia sp. WMMC193]